MCVYIIIVAYSNNNTPSVVVIQNLMRCGKNNFYIQYTYKFLHPEAEASSTLAKGHSRSKITYY